MKRHSSLIPLSSHHQNALVQAKRLRSKSLSKTAESRLEVAATFLKFWEKNGRTHFREEEEIVLPTLARFGEAHTREVETMLRQHIDIRSRIDAISERVKAQMAPSPDELEELGEILDAHVRLEEHEVFPYVEMVVPEEALLAMKDRLGGH